MNKVNNGEICIFEIPIDGNKYCVRCECYDSYVNNFSGSLAYGNTYYKNDKEYLHTNSGIAIDTIEKARKSIQNAIHLKEHLWAIDGGEQSG